MNIIHWIKYTPDFERKMPYSMKLEQFDENLIIYLWFALMFASCVVMIDLLTAIISLLFFFFFFDSLDLMAISSGNYERKRWKPVDFDPSFVFFYKSNSRFNYEFSEFNRFPFSNNENTFHWNFYLASKTFDSPPAIILWNETQWKSFQCTRHSNFHLSF